MLNLEEKFEPRFGFAKFERRISPRFLVNCPLKYWRGSAAKRSSGRTGNISEGGILLHVPDPIEVGENLRVRLFIGDLLALQTIDAVVTVVWRDFHLDESDHYRIGVKFVDILPDDLGKLKDFLKTLIRVKKNQTVTFPPRFLSALGISTVGTFTRPHSSRSKLRA